MTTIGEIFRALHKPGDPFILMNAWDQGSAKELTALGAQAIGTTSSGHAFTMGRADMGNVTRDEAMAHAQDIVAATHLPVSIDSENGYGDSPEDVAETVKYAAEIGLAGCSIEDTDMSDKGAYDFDLSVERIRAGIAAARALPHDFVFVARADGVMNGSYDTAEAMKRLKAYDALGADCLYAPMLPSLDDVRRVCEMTKTPINVLTVGPMAKYTHSEFAALGAARLSLGSGLARVTHGATINTAKAILEQGDFSEIANAPSGADIEKLLT